jgi:hypothetical protein
MARWARQQERRVDDQLRLAELDQRASYTHCHRFCGVEFVVLVCWLADCEFGLVVLGERKGLAYFCWGSLWLCWRFRSVLQCAFILSEFLIPRFALLACFASPPPLLLPTP